MESSDNIIMVEYNVCSELKLTFGARAIPIDKQKLHLMLFSSLNFYREASFFSRKSTDFNLKTVFYFNYLAAQVIKDTINPPKKIANAYSLFYMENYPQFKGTGKRKCSAEKMINYFRYENY